MRSRLLTVAVVVAVVVAGCSQGGSSDTAVTPTTGSVTTATSSTTQAPDSTPEPTESSEPQTSAELVEAADDEPIDVQIAGRIRAFFDTREAVNAGPEPDPNSTELAEVATGEALASAVSETQRRLDDGRAIRAGEQGLAEIRVGTVQVDGEAAQAAVCSIDDGVIYEVSSGEVVNDDVVTHNYLIEMELASDGWKVARVVRLQQWEGVAGCALAPEDFPL